MHIAICDDNVADRKQLERLLIRESDRRVSTTGSLYINSYGNASSLLNATLTYDAYYIDMCKTNGTTGMDLVERLTQKGIHSPIILCCSDINYRQYTFPKNVLFLDKPLNAAELSQSIDTVLANKRKIPRLIELRDNKHTHYVEERELLYAIESGAFLECTLTSHKKIKITSTARNFFPQVEIHKEFLMPSEKVVLNCRYIAKIGFRKITMIDGTKFSVHKACKGYALKMHAELSGKH